MNADTVDGVGNLVGEEALQALADHITAVMSRRYCAAMTDSCVRLPDGSLRYPLDVSFQNFTYVKAPGKRMSRKATFNYFDVPALPFYAARAQAFRMVEELQRTFAAHEINRPSFGPMIADAFGVEPPRGDMRRGVALRDNVVACFIEILGTVLKNGLANTNPEWLQKSAERSERWAADDAERHAAAKRDFSARMKAAKAAKKAAREGAAS
ncbi:hypothetical protein [Variovorax sp. UC74_104]|uniref:hypothetical protein n=1 Tax=Variovorax sp. UC74_104 TaxID=3374555 RepID=UPI0037571359